MKLLIIILGLVNIVIGLMNIASSYIDVDVLAFIIGASMVALGFWAISIETKKFKWSKIIAKWLNKPTKPYEKISLYDEMSNELATRKERLNKLMKDQQLRMALLIEESKRLLDKTPKVTNAEIALNQHTESDSKDYYQEVLDGVKIQKDETVL